MVGSTMPPRPEGLVLAPMRALRYESSRADLGSVLAPPYDVIDPAARAVLAASSPHNVVRLTLPEPAGDVDGYTAAARQLAAWRAEGVLRPDAEPTLTVYEQQAGGHRQRGLLGTLGLTPAQDRIVLPHENTMAGPVADRLALMAATEADLEPIFCVYDGGGAASEAVAAADREQPVAETMTPDGVHHRVWTLTDPDQLAAIATDLLPRRAVIADGHHRYATFLRYQADRHAAGDGPGPWDHGLAFLVDGSAFGPQVEPIHRAVESLPASKAAALAEQADGLSVAQLPGGLADADTALAGAPEHRTRVVLTDGEAAWSVTVSDPDLVAARMPVHRSAAWRALDVAVVHAYLVAQVWGLPDDEQTVSFHHDRESALAAATRGGPGSGVAVLLNPTPVAAVAAVAAQGEPMPRKSTLFVPKPATGVVIRDFADA
jgi:uncharacterized protein (DUF1015 family)